ncbi:MAG: hypothetical protein ACK53U_14150 [Alphaproteobacteria bacterium]
MRLGLSPSRGGNLPLWLRLGVHISLIIALAIGLISFLNYYNFEKSFRELNVARVSVVARDLRQAIEVGLNIGLAPRDNLELAREIAAAKDRTTGLRFATVIDEQGRRLLELGSAGVEQDWRLRLEGQGWLGEDADSYQIGLPYRNSFGLISGAIILGYDKAEINRATAKMRRALLTEWLIAVAAVSLLVMLGTWLITRRLRHELDVAESALKASAHEGSASRLHLPILGEEVEKGIADLIQKRASLMEDAAERSAHSAR